MIKLGFEIKSHRDKNFHMLKMLSNINYSLHIERKLSMNFLTFFFFFFETIHYLGLNNHNNSAPKGIQELTQSKLAFGIFS